MEEGRIVIVGYKPIAGQSQMLHDVLKKHVDLLRKEGLATERAAMLMRASNGTFVEVFEWVSEDAIALAHKNPVVQQLWKEFGMLCEYVPVGDLAEASQLFSEFRPV